MLAQDGSRCSGWLEMARDGSRWLEMARDGSGWPVIALNALWWPLLALGMVALLSIAFDIR